MFGIDLGIDVSSVTCINGKNEVLDSVVVYGNKNLTQWERIGTMMEYIVDSVDYICRSHVNTIIEPRVSIEEPVYNPRTRNAQSYFVLSCLYALVRQKLMKRGFKITSVHNYSAKSTARAVLSKKKIKSIYLGHNKHNRSTGFLNKKGMVRAFKMAVGYPPAHHTIAGRETLADSYFIARCGLDRIKTNASIKC